MEAWRTNPRHEDRFVPGNLLGAGASDDGGVIETKGKPEDGTFAEDNRPPEKSYRSWVVGEAAAASTSTDEFAVFERLAVVAHS